MKRFPVKQPDPSSESESAKCGKICTSKASSSSSSEPSPGQFDEDNDLTHCPDEQLLGSASREFGGRRRCPQADWFATYPWLVISRSRKVVFCSWCREATRSRVAGMAKSESAFTEKGFNNWKEGYGRITDHSASTAHGAAAMFVAQKTKPSVAAQINTQLAAEQEKCRKRLLAEINSIMFLMRQGLALRRGKDEANDNLHQLGLLKLLARCGVAEAGDCVSQRTHLSHDIVNELCNLIGQRVLRMLLDKFNNSRATAKYSILADETRDASGTEQLTVCLRWVDRSLLVHEDFLGMYSLSGHGQSANA